MWVPYSPLKWSIIAKNRMLSVPSVQVGPALPLVAAATASRSKPSSLHCTERPRMKTASAIRGRHEVSDTTLHSSSPISSSNTNLNSHLPSYFTNLCNVISRPYPNYMCLHLMNKHFSISISISIF